jgi:hypothetical protein
MDHLENLKKQLERDCLINTWNPTAFQLQQIATRLANFAALKKGDVTAIIVSVCPHTRFLVMDGIDNSDLRALLALAVQVANTKG